MCSVLLLFVYYRREEIARFIDSQMKGIEGFEAEIEKLVQAHEDKKIELKGKYLAYEVEMEKEFDDSMTKLMEKYTPHQSEPSASSWIDGMEKQWIKDSSKKKEQRRQSIPFDFHLYMETKI